jgi:flagellar hook-length control protein FliK
MSSEASISFSKATFDLAASRHADRKSSAAEKSDQPAASNDGVSNFGTLVTGKMAARPAERPDPRRAPAAERRGADADRSAAKGQRAEVPDNSGAKPETPVDTAENADAAGTAKAEATSEVTAAASDSEATASADTDTVEGTGGPQILPAQISTVPAGGEDPSLVLVGLTPQIEATTGGEAATVASTTLGQTVIAQSEAGTPAGDPALATAVATTPGLTAALASAGSKVNSIAGASEDAVKATGTDAAEGLAEDGASSGAPELAAKTAGAGEARTSDANGLAQKDARLAAGADEGAEGVKTGKTGSNLKKTALADIGPIRVSQFAGLLDGAGVSGAIHRPVDILASFDRTVQASVLNQQNTEVSRPTPLQMLPIEIGMNAVRGVTNFQIRLDPAELGRVEVKLHIRDNGEVNASLVVDRVETLAMLKRDASTLQYAFEQAGLKQSADGLSFSLRGEGQQGQDAREGNGKPSGQNDEAGLQPQISEIAMRRTYIPNSSLDLMI